MSATDVMMRIVRRFYHGLRIDRALAMKERICTGLQVPYVHERYENRLCELRKIRGRAIKVLFLVSDSSKWKMQSVFDAMKESDRFEPCIAVNLWGWRESLKCAEEVAKATVKFFARNKMQVVAVWDFDRHEPIPLSRHRPDIVFYGQPWDVHSVHMPDEVSRFALTCYVSYAVTTIDLMPCDVAMTFHRLLFRYFMQSPGWTEYAKKLRCGLSLSGEVVSTGHPMLDVFRGHDVSKENLDGPVIYAPHWSFPHRDNPNSMNISTFLWNGDAILSYAKKHPQIRWAFKPHPVLRNVLLKAGIMTDEEIKVYYGEWAKIGECCYDGDYARLFMYSRAMITDSGSFLTEYACTGRPVIRLISAEAKIHPCELSEKLLSTYYQVRKIEELEPVLDDLLVKGNDPNREVRQAAAKAMNLTGTDAAGNIIRHLEELIFGTSADLVAS